MSVTQSTPVSRKRRYSAMARFLHTTPDSTPTGGKQHQKQGKSNAPGILSKAPIQGFSATQHVQSPPGQKAQAGPWFLMTANTTNWMGAKALITHLAATTIHANQRSSYYKSTATLGQTIASVQRTGPGTKDTICHSLQRPPQA